MNRLNNYSEPAVLRGILTALVALAAALGYVVPADLSSAAEGLIPVVAFLVPLIQSVWTRRAVVSPRTHAEQLGRAEARLKDGPA